ncbi:helix-turn-helix domain-containing protein [Mesorhizobium sp. 10J20-29]
MSLSAAQCRAARALVGWSQDRLAAKSNVAKATIANFELGNRSPLGSTLLRLQEALTVAGVEFIPENGGGAGVRLRRSTDEPARPTEGEAGIIKNSDM